MGSGSERGTARVGDAFVKFGYFGIQDWLISVLESFPAPWSVGPLDGKYYGTDILDANGDPILSVWLSFGKPSDRQRGDMSDEEWSDYCCDSHWESETSLNMATVIVACRNELADERTYYKDPVEELLQQLVFTHGRWDGRVEPLVRCGGPLRRPLTAEEARGKE